jgi:RNA polymerase sigma-70 factor (ECF subfamily)
MECLHATLSIFIDEEKKLNCREVGLDCYTTFKQNTLASKMIDAKEVVSLQQLIASSADQPAYIRLFRIYFTSLLHFAQTFIKSKPVAEEIVSDVFFQVWQNRASLPGINNLTVYLYTCIRNRSLTYLQKQKKEMTIWLDEASPSLPHAGPDPEQLYITSELAVAIDSVVEDLPPKCRMIFKMIRVDGLKYREVSEIMDISQKTVEAQMGIAMKKIHEAIRPYTDSGTRPVRSKSVRID